MRLILTMLLLAVLPATTALAADDCRPSACDCSVCAAADSCARVFTVACIRLKYTPRCDRLAHLCAVPYAPCGYDICLDPPDHQCPMPCTPCGWELCLDPPAHQPVTGAEPCDPCPPDPLVTGNRELIAAPCTCTGESGCECAADDCR